MVCIPTCTHFDSDCVFVNPSNPWIDGRQERVQFDKITARVSRLCYGLDTDHVDPVAITQKVISGVYGGVTTVQLDDLVSQVLYPLIKKSSR